MASRARKHADDLREAARLAVEATTGVTGVVEDMHLRIASGPAVLGKPFALPARLFTGIAYGNVRLVTRLVGKSIDWTLERLAPVLGESAPGLEREALVAALNGVLGDWLARTKSPFALELELHREAPGPKQVVLLHGSGMSHRHWLWQGHDHGAALARDYGFTPVYVQYNSGLPIAQNGRLLAERLEELANADEIALVGVSMGGLVARSACHAAETEGRSWRKKLRTLVTLGTPHLGAPLERGGALVDAILPISSYSAPLLPLAKIRSAGITDMRYGIDLPLPEGVACHAIAAANDLLVPVASAHGPFPEAHCSIIPNIGHLDLLSSLEAYDTIRQALST